MLLMLDEIEQYTSKFKMGLIRLGYCLPPASAMHSNKIKQINLDFNHMYIEFVNQQTPPHLFDIVSEVILATTGQYYQVNNLPDLLLVIKKSYRYLVSY